MKYFYLVILVDLGAVISMINSSFCNDKSLKFLTQREKLDGPGNGQLSVDYARRRDIVKPFVVNAYLYEEVRAAIAESSARSPLGLVSTIGLEERMVERAISDAVSGRKNPMADAARRVLEKRKIL